MSKMQDTITELIVLIRGLVPSRVTVIPEVISTDRHIFLRVCHCDMTFNHEAWLATVPLTAILASESTDLCISVELTLDEVFDKYRAMFNQANYYGLFGS